MVDVHLKELAADVAALLRYQQELGLRSLVLSEATKVSTPRAPAEQASATQAPPAADPTVGLALDGEPALALRSLRELIGDCQRCKLCSGRTQLVFGAGHPRARVMFVGEAPGRDEDLTGEPFVGEAGQLLTKMIVAMGFARADTYIANVVKCRPPKNRDPEADEVASCEPFLKAQIRVVKPTVIVALGRYAVQTLLRDKTAISRLRGQWRTYEGIALMPTFHPAYLLREPSEKKLVWQDLQAVMRKLEGA